MMKINKNKNLDLLFKLFHQRNYSKSKKLAINLLKDYPKEFIIHKILGFIFKIEKNYKDSIIYFKNALNITNNDLEVLFNLSISYYLNNEINNAEIEYRKLIKIDPKHIDGNYNLAILLSQKGRVNESLELYNFIIKLNPNHVNAYNNIGLIFLNQSKINIAIKYFNTCLKINPKFYKAHINLGIAHKYYGDFKMAEKFFKKAIFLSINPSEAYYNLSLIKKINSGDSFIDELHKLLNNKALSLKDKFHFYFSIAKALEDTNNFKESFNFYLEANKICKYLSNYSKDFDIEAFKNIKKNYQDIEKITYQYSNNFNVKPIFILGMPRSGTTLIEQIISSHNSVIAGGEINYINIFGKNLLSSNKKFNQNDLIDFSNKYLKNLQTHSRDKKFITDKMPLNFRYIGLILKVFPNAKIIHTVRNPFSVCMSIFTKYFPNKELNFSYDLEDILTYHNLYKNLMSFWEDKFKDKIYILDYEKLISNQIEEIKKLINYLELPWDNNCLYPENNKNLVLSASSFQVRQKINKESSNKWKSFEPFLNNKLNNFDL